MKRNRHLAMTSVPNSVPSTDPDKSDQIKQTLPATVGTTPADRTPGTCS